MKQLKPWERSTGPKTKAGKAKSSQNAFKHGLYTAETRAALRQINKLIRLASDTAEEAMQEVSLSVQASPGGNVATGTLIAQEVSFDVWLD